ncbi:D-alanyl-D-alanine carboxypeptidase [Clostridium sp. A1-XYC3]|uniref:D-alanyl-D-alanine carboxypeptidase n=1 Tax=Clostridium tanneri TaxID=3037988 RepID=A0ABU4JQA9_9CLOT|nr:D-alanyl-D-alanine carboxypeptidase [Clostridium sp. A1-XYC3]MDW8800319.1 D-alanyl-D-alanine carboxypeptidase [Clostridium sp. A1-XYC3]
MMEKIKKKESKFFVLLIIAIIVFIYIFNFTSNGKFMFIKTKVNKAGETSLLTTVPDPSLSVLSKNLNSPNAILIQLDNLTVLMEKNSSQRIYPASLTKIMTAIVAIENLQDLQENIKLSNATFHELYKEDASIAGFKPDENVRAIDLLYGVILPSGAECSIGLADHIAGSEKKFVEIMNQKAMALGMRDTHFTNSTGLQDSNHYTTVRDLSILLSYALKNNTFRDIFTSSRYSTTPTNKHPEGITFHSTMFKNMENPVIDGGRILGGKTGYTDRAGLCLASLAEKGGREYILVTAGAKGNHKSEQYNIDDAYAVYNKLGKYKKS